MNLKKIYLLSIVLLVGLLLGGTIVAKLGPQVKNRVGYLIKKYKNENQVEAHWLASPWPDGHDFAFTIVHDPDHAYSKRLSPLFRAFDDFGMKITAAVFIYPPESGDPGYKEFSKGEKERLEAVADRDQEFWGPSNVPLTDKSECLFYKDLAARGHEIGMHTPSPISDNREKVIKAFEYFKNIFGSYPKVYVDHWPGGNKETQSNEGADPTSAYYCTDILNQYGSWIWADIAGLPWHEKEEFYDVLASNGTPFNEKLRKECGILKGFVRTGKYKQGDGDGFLEWYTETNIDSLKRNRGLALVYAHLEQKWLDPNTKEMRSAISNRLEYLVSKDGWFVPAGQILDRYEVMNQVFLSYNERWLKVINNNPFPVEGVTLLMPQDQRCDLVTKSGVKLKPNQDNEIVIDRLSPFETLSILFQPE